MPARRKEYFESAPDPRATADELVDSHRPSRDVRALAARSDRDTSLGADENMSRTLLLKLLLKLPNTGRYENKQDRA
jgi:hypothetical protein